MNEPNPVQLEVEALCGELIDGHITNEQRQRLEKLVQSDTVAKRTYIEFFNLHAALYRYNSTHVALPNTPNQASGDAGSPILGFLGDVFRQGTDFLSRSFVLTLLVAIGLPGLVLLIFVLDMSRQVVVPAPEPHVAVAPVHVTPAPATVARITNLHRCVWKEGSTQATVGAKLSTGQTLELKEGLVELAFADGAKVILRGPATFDTINVKRGFLHVGSLVANVPKGAEGFAVATPTAEMIDLGTEFGVSVDAAGVCEAHVFAGQIEVGVHESEKDAPGEFEFLTVGQGTRIEKTEAGAVRTETIVSAPRNFVRRIAPDTIAGLPEPTVVFRHQGDRDPTTEGWEHYLQKDISIPVTNVNASPTPKDQAPAWFLNDSSKEIGIHYRKTRLPRSLVDEAKEKGWVMRARVKVAGRDSAGKLLAFYSYWLKGCKWALRIGVGKDGNQCLTLDGKSSLGENRTVDLPNSRDAYVDYEVRYYPETHDADVYVNGKLLATGYYMPCRLGAMLHFGTFQEYECEASFARIEWGIIRQD
ncbi:MAG: FecR domain-containing protein [Pirellulales bacterium]|nr:FecR domain-containing protein [Pirellulales bacterium]